MYIISKDLKSARYLPHKLENRIAAVKMLRNSPRGSIANICRKYHISRSSLWRMMHLYYSFQIHYYTQSLQYL